MNAGKAPRFRFNIDSEGNETPAPAPTGGAAGGAAVAAPATTGGTATAEEDAANALSSRRTQETQEYLTTRPQDRTSQEYSTWRQGFFDRYGYDPDWTSNAPNTDANMAETPGMDEDRRQAWYKREEEKSPRQPWTWPHYQGPKVSFGRAKRGTEWGYVKPDDLYSWYSGESKKRGRASLGETQFRRRYEAYMRQGGSNPWLTGNFDFMDFYKSIMGIDLQALYSKSWG